MEMVKQKLVVVLGMHRSGTSTITRGLKVMGVDLGDRMMVPVPGNNDKGFWEDVDLNKLNIDILLALGLDWQYLKPIDQADLHFLRENGYFLQAVELLRQKVKNIPVFGFKDPRVSKLLPFWKEVFSHCQFDVSYVFALRNPLSVAQSLAKRNYFVNEHSYLLWLEHVMTSVVESTGAKRVIVDFDEMVQNPERELNRMAAHLDLAINQEQLRDFKSEFLDQSLRHNVNQSNDLLEDKSCPSLVREIYFALLDIASEKSKDDSPQFLKKLQDWLKEFGDLKSTMLLLDPFIAGHAAV